MIIDPVQSWLCSFNRATKAPFETVDSPKPVFTCLGLIIINVSGFIGNAPHIVFGTAFRMRPADGFPLEWISRFAVTFHITGSAIKIKCVLTISKGHNGGEGLALEIGNEEFTHLFWVKKLIGAPVIFQRMNIEFFALAGYTYHAIEVIHII